MITVSKSRINEVLVINDEVIKKVEMLVSKIKPLQDKLNKELAKTDDYAKTLKVSNGKYINYGDCLASECDEIRNSTPWKHWKFAGELDKDNLNLETADIFHFAPSVELVIDANVPRGHFTELDNNRLVNSIDDINMTIDFITNNTDVNIELNDLINIIIHIITDYNSLIAIYFNKIKYYKTLTINELNDIKTTNMTVMLLAIYNHQFVFNTTIDESIEMIYSTYVVKNTLNKFRNNNGYNTGEYVKMWDGIEDNMVAMDIMSKYPDYTPDELYTELIKSYANAIK